jgi:hypothetical protein
VRLAVAIGFVMLASCAKQANSGPLGDSPTPASPTRIASVDSTLPPRHVSVQLDQPGYATVILVAPGHSATILYPADSAADNRLGAGNHTLRFQIPEGLVQTDSQRMTAISRARDTGFSVRRSRPRGITPLSASTPTYLLVISSPQQLSWQKMRDKTTGVTIPVADMEALNAIAKAVKSTLATEPREWAGYYRQVEIRPPAPNP